MATLRDLANRIKQLDKKLTVDASKRAIAVADAVLADLIDVTPADVTTALSNWQIGINAPVSGPAIPAYVPGSLGYTITASSEKALAVGREKLATKKPGETIYISNVTEYIRELDRGSSRQFAGGFVARARIVARNALAGYKSK